MYTVYIYIYICVRVSVNIDLASQHLTLRIRSSFGTGNASEASAVREVASRRRHCYAARTGRVVWLWEYRFGTFTPKFHGFLWFLQQMLVKTHGIWGKCWQHLPAQSSPMAKRTFDSCDFMTKAGLAVSKCLAH